jgi:hypothetical protein
MDLSPRDYKFGFVLSNTGFCVNDSLSEWKPQQITLSLMGQNINRLVTKEDNF